MAYRKRRGDLAAAVRNHLKAIAAKGAASPLDKAVLDSATSRIIEDQKFKALRNK